MNHSPDPSGGIIAGIILFYGFIVSISLILIGLIFMIYLPS